MKVFSMFTGIGGFDLAFRNLGHEIVGACEIDKYARDIYAKHFPNVKIYHDATTMSPESLPSFDLLCAGFPCQTFSVAGKRAGFDDPRGNLFFEIARIAKEKRPRYLFLENVKGLLSHDQGETFRVIISTLDEMGYDAEWQLLNSKYFVPQNRERIFIIGHLRGERTRQVFPLGDCGEVNNGTRYETQREGERISGSYSTSLQTTPNKGTSTLIEEQISNTIDANYHKGGSRTMIEEPEIKHIINSENQSYRVYNPEGISPTLCVGNGSKSPNISNPEDCREKDMETMVYLSNTNANMKERIQDREESWTLGTGTDFGLKEGKRIRRLTPLECERLQGFPDNWTEGISDTQRYKCCGNAVTVPVVEYIAKHFIEADGI